MNETGHTPGPWLYYNNMVFEARRFPISPIAIIDQSAPHMTPAQRDQTGKLIAAAPELLAACETAIAVMTHRLARPNATQILTALQSAIAKATGTELK